MTRWKVCAVLAFGLAATTAALGDPQWPNVDVDGPKWPSVRTENLPSPSINARPRFADAEEVTARIMGEGYDSSTRRRIDDALDQLLGTQGPETTGSTARWPSLQPVKTAQAYLFEVGARYWYSGSAVHFGFNNGSPLFGDPTSTLDWRGMSGQTGEVFARVDHVPSGVFVKGVFGMGKLLSSGSIDDRDFFTGQFKFSDTTSNVENGDIMYAMADVGWAYWPNKQIRVGVFAGYHYWREKMGAFGLLCNQASLVTGCAGPGAMPVGGNVQVFSYEPTWHAVRLGAEGKVVIDQNWSVSGEIAAVPYAVLQNKDSHLLRQSQADLGPAPNVITNTSYGFGLETELFVNYALTPNLEIGAGARYWGLVSYDGGVQFGPSFASSYALNKFDQQRYGVLVQVKGRF